MPFGSPEKKLQRAVEHIHDVGDAQFCRELSVLLGPNIQPGNRVELLNNGREIFPAMLEAIRGAQRTITFETYIYWSGDIGRRFADALCDRARNGVRVHVLLDWVGSVKMTESTMEIMEAAGIEVKRYHKPHLSLRRLNNRTHRKLLIIDGTIGFCGGVGIADQWEGDAEDPEHWRDMHFRVHGPVVNQMQAAFLDNWIKMTGRLLHGSDYFPRLEAAGDLDAHMFVSSPAGGSASMLLMYLMTLGAASSSIDLANAYFVPDKLTMEALLAARGRGVRVRILVPGEHMDAESVRLASRRAWGPLLEAGAQIFAYEPTMMHTKLLIVDGCMVSVGSTNFDSRSFERNDECSLNIYDSEMARCMSEVFEADLERARAISFEAWKHRPLREKLAELLVQPIKSQI